MSSVPLSIPSSVGGAHGSSPPPSKQSPCTAARKFFKRLQYDTGLDRTQFTIGLLETREQPERKSGAEAWSLRIQSSLVELSFPDFVAKFETTGLDIPFHRIAFYKQNGLIVWESESLRSKLAATSNEGNGHHHSYSNGSAAAPNAALSSSFYGCSPPAGSLMARLAADGICNGTPAAAVAATAGTGLPPRSGSITSTQPHSSNTSGSFAGNVHLTLAAATPEVVHGTSSGNHSSRTLSYQCPSMGSSPSNGPLLYESCPKLSGSWAGSSKGLHDLPHSGSGHHSLSMSPAGSCSSWTGSRPIAAAAAGGSGGALMTADLGMPSDLVGTVLLQGQSSDHQLQQQSGLADAELPELADYSALPEECWVNVLQRLRVRELCTIIRVSRSLRSLASRPFLWSIAYRRLFGSPPAAEWSGATVKRMCRRSELRASRWLEADVTARACGFADTTCCQLDASKAVSGDGCAVRLWALDSGRRIATLRGHSGRVTAVAFDDEYIVSGCSQGTVKVWSMDELKLYKTLRHHTAPVTAAAIMAGLPVTGSKDGSVCVWDLAAPSSPLATLEVGTAVQDLKMQEERGQLVTASSALGVWDMNTTQLVYTLTAPAAAAILPSSSSTNSLRGTVAGSGAGTPSAAGSNIADATIADELDLGDLLLHDGWLDQDGIADVGSDGDSDSGVDDDGDELGNGIDGMIDSLEAASGVGTGGGGGGAKPFTSVSCSGNLVAAGRDASVVVWDIRSQDPVALFTPSVAFNSSSSRMHSGSTSPIAACAGVQLDDWKLVTGWNGIGASDNSGRGSSGSNCWWHSSSIAAADLDSIAGGHSLAVYDIRAAASFSSCNRSSNNSGDSSSRRLYGSPLISLPVPNKVTCFQCHGQHLLVGQEGGDCCLLTFNPPGTSSKAAAAAAWGYGAGGSSSSSNGARNGHGNGAYGASPGASGTSHQDDACSGDGGVERSTGKGKKKGAAKVPAKKQTRYPKRATR